MAFAEELHKFDYNVAICDRSVDGQSISGVSSRIFTCISIGCRNIFLNQFLLLFGFVQLGSDCFRLFLETLELFNLAIQLDHFQLQLISVLLGFLDIIDSTNCQIFER